MSQRTGFTGSALVRLLARLTDIAVPESKQSFSDRLSQWLRWTDAISLSAVLNAGPTANDPAVRARARPALGAKKAEAEEAEFTRVRTALIKTIAEESASMRGGAAEASAAFTAYRRRYVARQQAMEAGIGPLRARLRASLAARSPAMARLAELDAVMEQALEAHESRVLSTVPTLLEKHFKRLRQAELSLLGDAPPAGEIDGAAPTATWLALFGKDMQSVLLAELDIRLQPVEGLLEALRTT